MVISAIFKEKVSEIILASKSVPPVLVSYCGIIPTPTPIIAPQINALAS